MRNILEEKIQLIEVLEGMYANVRVDTTFARVLDFVRKPEASMFVYQSMNFMLHMVS